MILYTIGHSNQSLNSFCAILERYSINMLCDVRSLPYSRYCPHFNQRHLQMHLQQIGINYRFMGEFLGGRQSGIIKTAAGLDYSMVAAKKSFAIACSALQSLLERGHCPTLMCAEKDPQNCHRFSLICRYLTFKIDIKHILADATLIDHQSLINEQQSKILAKPKVIAPLNTAEATLFD